MSFKIVNNLSKLNYFHKFLSLHVYISLIITSGSVLVRRNKKVPARFTIGNEVEISFFNSIRVSSAILIRMSARCHQD